MNVSNECSNAQINQTKIFILKKKYPWGYWNAQMHKLIKLKYAFQLSTPVASAYWNAGTHKWMLFVYKHLSDMLQTIYCHILPQCPRILLRGTLLFLFISFFCLIRSQIFCGPNLPESFKVCPHIIEELPAFLLLALCCGQGLMVSQKMLLF